MKIRLEYEFDLPEDREQFDIVTKANHLDYVIHKLDNYLISKIKYEGLPFGKLVMIAGDSDSGKTSTAMKAAQKQEVGIIYVETEGKTTENDLVNWGVDPNGILLVQSSIAEEAFELLFALLCYFFIFGMNIQEDY